LSSRIPQPQQPHPATLIPAKNSLLSQRAFLSQSKIIPPGNQSIKTNTGSNRTTNNNSNNSNHSPLNYEAAKELTTKFLNLPNYQQLGSFDSSTWQEMARLLRFWTRYETSESVNASFALLERLVAEQEILLQNQTGQNGASSSSPLPSSSAVQRLMSEQDRRELLQLSREILNTNQLNSVINCWRNSWKSNDTKISPMAMFHQLEQYIGKSPSLHPDKKTYNMTMDAASKRFSSNLSANIGQQILKRMTSHSQPTDEESLSSRIDTTPTMNNRLRCRNDISPDEYTYTTLMNIYANAGNPKAAEDLLNQLRKDYAAGRSTIQPTVRMFTACIKAWQKSRLPNAPEQAEEVLKRMHQLDADGTLPNVEPNIFSYNCLIDCWAKSDRPEGPERAEDVLQRLEASDSLQPDQISYHSVISAWSHVSVERAEAVLRRMYQSFKSGNYAAKPNRDSYHMVMVGLQWVAVSDSDAARRAQMYLKRIKQLGLNPNITSYNCVLACFAKADVENAGGSAEALLREMKAPPGKHDRFAPVPVKPNSNSYTSVINAYAKNGKGKQAEMIFRSMYREHNQGNTSVVPKIQNFNAVLSAWEKTKNVSADDRIKAMLKLLHELPKSGPLGIKPDITSANTLLICLARSASVENCNHAEKIVLNLEAEYEETKDDSVRPDKYSYTSLMKAHANVGNLEGAQRTLKRMMEQYESGNKAAKPDVFAFNNLLLAIARWGKGRRENSGLLAEEVFNTMRRSYKSGDLDTRPNLASYTLRINCWAVSGDPRAGENADSILDEMEELAQNGEFGIKPDALVISNAINAHAQSGYHVRAESLLQRMLTEYGNGNGRMKPTLQTINMVLLSLARANSTAAAEKAEGYLREMLVHHASLSVFDIQPDTVTFTTVISAWANSGDPRAADRAKSLLREADMYSRSEDHDITLDAPFFCSVLQACAKAGDFVIAEALLQDIVDNELNGVKVDRRMFLPLLEAYSKSELKDAGEKAEALLTQMQSLAQTTGSADVRPSFSCFRFVLECWAKEKENLKLAAERSEALLRQMEESADDGESNLKPDSTTYSL